MAEWVEALLARGVPCGPVNDMAQAVADPQVAARDMLCSARVSSRGDTVRMVANPLHFFTAGNATAAGTPPELAADQPPARHPARRPPNLGEHTREVLREHLHMSESEIDTLIQAGVVQAHTGVSAQSAAAQSTNTKP